MNEDEYKPVYCELMEMPCVKDCEHWDGCPIEEHDIADGKYIKRVIEIRKKKEKGNE